MKPLAFHKIIDHDPDDGFIAVDRYFLDERGQLCHETTTNELNPDLADELEADGSIENEDIANALGTRFDKGNEITGIEAGNRNKVIFLMHCPDDGSIYGLNTEGQMDRALPGEPLYRDFEAQMQGDKVRICTIEDTDQTRTIDHHVVSTSLNRHNSSRGEQRAQPMHQSFDKA